MDEIYLMDEQLQEIMPIDTAKSVIWNRKYCGAGDFEICIPVTEENIHRIRDGCFAWRENGDTVMVVEKIQQKKDLENGDYLILSGKSAEVIIDRRIVWEQTNLNGNIRDEVIRLIRENVTEPADAGRKIPLIVIGEAAETTEEVERQLRGEGLLTCITEILSAAGMGCELKFADDSLSFCINRGTDRSEGNMEGNIEVVFSEEYDNLLASEYIRDCTEYKNVTLVAGEGEGTARKTAVFGEVSGLERREMYIESSASTNDGEIDASAYDSMLAEEGKAALQDKKMVETFNGEIVPDGNFVFGTDYFLGDFVTIKNQYGMSAKVRVTEITENVDENGHNLVVGYENV